MSSHGRSLSHADAASRHTKRLSLNFPVQPAAAAAAAAANPSIPTPRSRPASWIGTSPVRSPEHLPHSPDANFFTALAAQERRVLELREELAKAEDTLTELKKQWATHEAARLGQKGAYGFHPLQPVDTVLANGLFDDDADGPSWAEKEMERRRMILHGQRQSNRKVFSGSRHTRTLSLLSPTKSADDDSFSTAIDATLDEPSVNPPRGRSSTTPVDSSLDRTESQDGTSEALLRTGRQMASDLKDGIITFWGDLRQAAIGDEAASSPPRSTPHQNGRRLTNDAAGLCRSRTVNTGRRKSKSIHPSGDSSSLIDIETNFWKEHGIEALRAPQPAITKPSPTKSPQKTMRGQPSSQTLDDASGWEDWDATEPEKENSSFAPAHSSSNSSVSELRTSPSESERSSPRTSTRYVATKAGQLSADEMMEAHRAGKPLRNSTTDSNSPRHTSASTTATDSPNSTTWRALNKLAPRLVASASSPSSPLRYILYEWDSIVSSPGVTSPTAAQACMAESAAWEEYLSGTGNLATNVEDEVKSGVGKNA